MPLSWNEIKTRAAAFTKDWEGTQREEADAKSFLDAFFHVFDVSPSSGGGARLADLYDLNTMPPTLVKAHQQLDKAVDLCYRSQPFANETKRIEFLFELYDKYTSGMFVGERKTKQK
ncbi:MAG: hypothetical protein EOO10_10905 [Chitinophagaceae bacterium]|nr:MAG: hypothetical protein EOO10_10905 [Chitinophagaceae bacterium]